MAKQPSESRLTELEAKWLDGSITPEEAKEYADWYNAGQDDEVNIPASFAASREAHSQRMLSAIQASQRRVIPFKTIRWAAAAVAILAIGICSWLYWRQTPTAEKYSPELAQEQALPSRIKGAMLTLSNGQQILLDSAGNGVLTKDQQAQVTKSDGQLNYSLTEGSGSGHATGELLYNTLTTDKGKQWKLTLPDGSRVWLNAASSIRFPLQFPAHERAVEITGEVYFEVVHHAAQPFRVKAGAQQVEDIGTSFNVNAYADDHAISTTLLEGAARVSGTNGSVTLSKAGEQAQQHEKGAIKVLAHADIEAVMAWKNGMFSFQGADIESIMKQVARWYDVDITIEHGITEKFFIEVSRNTSVQDLFRILEKAGGVHITQQGRTVTIKP